MLNSKLIENLRSKIVVKISISLVQANQCLFIYKKIY